MQLLRWSIQLKTSISQFFSFYVNLVGAPEPDAAKLTAAFYF